MSITIKNIKYEESKDTETIFPRILIGDKHDMKNNSADIDKVIIISTEEIKT